MLELGDSENGTETKGIPISCALNERTFLKLASWDNAEGRAPSAVHLGERMEAAEAKLHAAAGRRGREAKKDDSGLGWGRRENQMKGHGFSDFWMEPAWGRVSGDGGRLLKRAGWWEGEGHKHCREVSSLRRGHGIHLSSGTADREGLSTCPLWYFPPLPPS